MTPTQTAPPPADVAKPAPPLAPLSAGPRHSPRARNPLSPYAVAVVAVIAMAALRLWLNPLLGNQFPFITFFPAIFLVAWLGGWWPTIVATLLSASLSVLLVMTPLGLQPWTDTPDVIGLLLFVTIGLATGALGEAKLRDHGRITELADLANKAGSAERLEGLIVAARTLISEVSLDRVLQQVVEVAAGVIKARYAAIGVLAPDGRLLESFTTYGIDDEQRALIGPPPRGHGILGLVIREGRPIRLPDLGRHPDSYGFPPHHPPMRSFLGVPIVGKQGIFGNLYLTEKLGGGLFSDEDEHIAILLAAKTAAAVENARLHEESARLLEEVQQLHRARERFFAMVNHELRNALAAVHGWSEMLIRKKDPATVPKAAFEVLESAQQAVGLINDLLDLSRLDEDRLKPVIRATDPASMARRALARVTPAAEAKRVLLDVDVEPDLPSCETDAARVEQILINLLGNAIHHTPEGSTVRLYVTGQMPWLVYTVEDAGEGIPESELEQIFDIYVTKAESESRGMGLGLPLSRRLARLLGGELKAVAHPGRGGRFVLELPATPEREEVFIRASART